MGRKVGYYKVKNSGLYHIAHWYNDCWWLAGSEHHYEDRHMDEICELVISDGDLSKTSESGLNKHLVIESASNAFDRGFTAGYNAGVEVMKA